MTTLFKQITEAIDAIESGDAAVDCEALDAVQPAVCKLLREATAKLTEARGLVAQEMAG